MMSRCNNPRNIAFQRYAGKGITVCDRWKVYENFFGDMGCKPSPKHTIERIDNHKSYYPGNCKWALRIEQNSNKSNNILVCWDDHVMTLGHAAKFFGFRCSQTVHRRIRVQKWSVSKALTTPLQRVRKYDPVPASQA
jgi:hypothetical protein